MEELPEDIHDYIVSYISDLQDLLTIPRINKQFQTISKRYRHPLIVTDKEWMESKWVSIMHSISNIYSNINEIHFKRCNITEQALSGFLMRSMKIINLRECRQITNNLNWLNNLNKTKCNTLSLAKCSKLPEFTHIINHNIFNHLNTLLLDRQSFKQIHCNIFSTHLVNIQTLAIVNTNLYIIPLTFLTQFKYLKYLFLGGSMIFDQRLKHLLFNVKSIFKVLDAVKEQLEIFVNLDGQDENMDENFANLNISEIKNNDPLSSESKEAALIQILSWILLIMNKLHENGLKLIELSYFKPINISLSKLYKYKEDNYTDVHFDGLSIAKLIFINLIHKYYASNMIILDLSTYPFKYNGLNGLCHKYNNIRIAIQYVVDLAINEFGQTVLHIAASSGNTKYVTELLDNGVYCDPRDRRGSTPLFQASVHNHYEIVNLLINSGADIFKRKTTKETPMEIACMRSNIESIKIMLSSTSIDNLNDNMKYDNQWSPIHCCCISGNIQILNLLINTGLNYAAQNIWKQTPLHICAIKNYIECATVLINKYNLKELLLRDEFNKTAEKIAYEHNNHDIGKLIRYRRQKLEYERNVNVNVSRDNSNEYKQNYHRNDEYNQRYYNYNYNGNGNGRYRRNNYYHNQGYNGNRYRGGNRGRGSRGRGRGRNRRAGYYYRRKQT